MTIKEKDFGSCTDLVVRNLKGEIDWVATTREAERLMQKHKTGPYQIAQLMDIKPRTKLRNQMNRRKIAIPFEDIKSLEKPPGSGMWYFEHGQVDAKKTAPAIARLIKAEGITAGEAGKRLGLAPCQATNIVCKEMPGFLRNEQKSRFSRSGKDPVLKQPIKPIYKDLVIRGTVGGKKNVINREATAQYIAQIMNKHRCPPRDCAKLMDLPTNLVNEILRKYKPDIKRGWKPIKDQRGVIRNPANGKLDLRAMAPVFRAYIKTHKKSTQECADHFKVSYSQVNNCLQKHPDISSPPPVPDHLIRKGKVYYRACGQVDGKMMAPIIKEMMETRNLSMADVANELKIKRNQVAGILNRYFSAGNRPTSQGKAKPGDARNHASNNITKFAEFNYDPKSCQYIEGNILTDEHKCGKPALPGKAWCAACFKRVYRVAPAPAQDDGASAPGSEHDLQQASANFVP